MSDSPTRLVEELSAKAWQSTRWSKGKKPADHVCQRAADKIVELCNGGHGMIPARAVREIFTRRLNLTHDQRAYSWHEIQDALEEVVRMATDHP